MNYKRDTGVFVLATKTKPTRYFGVMGFNTVFAERPDSVETVVFHRDAVPGRKTAICRTGWHEELWDRLTTRTSIYRPERLPDKPREGL